MFAFGVFHPETGDEQIDTVLSRAQVFATDPKKFELLSLYMQRTNRDMQKTLDRLTVLQTARKARRQQDLEEAASLLQLNEMKHLPVKETEIKGQNGFVFSIPEVRHYLNRKRQMTELQTEQERQLQRYEGKLNHRRREKRHFATAA
jgi:hypothetical protein